MMKVRHFSKRLLKREYCSSASHNKEKENKFNILHNKV